MGLFNKKNAISIEFCADEVRVVEGRYNKKNVLVNRCFTIPVPEGLYEDGVIKDTDEFSNIMNIGLSKHNIHRGEVYGVINSSNIIIREIRIPKVEEKLIASIINYQLDEYLPVDPEGYVVQFIPLNTVEEEGVEKQNIMLIGVPKFMVETHLNLLQNLGLKPVSLDYAGNAISKLIRSTEYINGIYDKNITVACLDLEEESTALNITNNGTMSISRVLKEEINPIVNDDTPFKTLDDSYDQDVAVVSGIKSNFAVILDKVDMVFRYYNSRETNNDIKLVLIYGKYSYIDGIESMMSSYLDRPCVRLNVFDKVDFSGDLAIYANAIGALIRDINFFEPYIEKQEFKFNKMILLYTFLALCIFGVAAIGTFNQIRINMLKSQIENKREVAEDAKTVKKYNQIKELENEMMVFKEEVDKIVQMDKNIVQTDIIRQDLISEIKSKMPADLFLTNFNANGREIQISGVAKDSNSVAEFSKSLTSIKDVESVFISTIDVVENNYNFVLNTTFKDVNIDESKSQKK